MKRSRLKPGKPLKRSRMKRKGRKKPTAKQQAYHDIVRFIGCIVCGNHASIHHIREGLGMGQAVNHDEVLPLCYDDHQSEESGCVSLHGDPAGFVKSKGTEMDLKIKLRKKLKDIGYEYNP